jgi:ABC-type transport system involved in multi-copper enzyme maturation permease subunit
MSPISIITRLTLREALRRKIVLAALLVGASFLLVYSIGFHIILDQANSVAPSTLNSGSGLIAKVEGQNFLSLAGLYTVTFLSIAMAALLSADALAGEISSGTIQSLVTKPVRRSDIVLGKWLGFAVLLGLYLLLMGGGIIASVWLQSGYVIPNLLAGIGLIYMEALLVMTVALMCSSRFSALATGAVVFGLYGLAFIGGWVEQFGSFMQNQTAVYVGVVSSLILPSEALWRRASFEMESALSGMLGISPFGTISVPSILMIVYAGVYMLVALAVTLRVFSHRDL